MILSEAKSLTMVAEGSNEVDIHSDPHPMGGMNHVAVTLHIESIIDQSSGTPSLTVYAEGSNDGVEYSDVNDIVITAATTTGLHMDDGACPYAFLRFRFSLNPNGSGTELAFMTFDVQANLTQT